MSVTFSLKYYFHRVVRLDDPHHADFTVSDFRSTHFSVMRQEKYLELLPGSHICAMKLHYNYSILTLLQGSRTMSISDFSYILSILLGVSFLGSVLWVRFTDRPFGKQSVYSGLIGLVLIGMPVWTSIQISVSEDGSLHTNLSKGAIEQLVERQSEQLMLVNKPQQFVPADMPEGITNRNQKTEVVTDSIKMNVLQTRYQDGFYPESQREVEIEQWAELFEIDQEIVAFWYDTLN